LHGCRQKPYLQSRFGEELRNNSGERRISTATTSRTLYRRHESCANCFDRGRVGILRWLERVRAATDATAGRVLAPIIKQGYGREARFDRFLGFLTSVCYGSYCRSCCGRTAYVDRAPVLYRSRTRMAVLSRVDAHVMTGRLQDLSPCQTSLTSGAVIYPKNPLANNQPAKRAKMRKKRWWSAPSGTSTEQRSSILPRRPRTLQTLLL
jgi:hypothetical protein